MGDFSHLGVKFFGGQNCLGSKLFGVKNFWGQNFLGSTFFEVKIFWVVKDLKFEKNPFIDIEAMGCAR